jgi:hypothetical protein
MEHVLVLDMGSLELQLAKKALQFIFFVEKDYSEAAIIRCQI